MANQAKVDDEQYRSQGNIYSDEFSSFFIELSSIING